MALLTADDVLQKKFQSVKFREGYDQIEVDEFLDEVVGTIYSLTVENTELKEKLEAANRRIAELSSGEVESAAVEETVVETAPEPEAPEQPAEEVVEEAVVEQVVAPAPVAPAPAADGPEAATSMLALAQKLHDEYVNDGRAEAERIVAEAQAEGSSIVAEANDKRDAILKRLGDEQQDLEQTINNLREFESDYRSAISSHLETLLKEVSAAPAGDK